jgi:hypothetical protein
VRYKNNSPASQHFNCIGVVIDVKPDVTEPFIKVKWTALANRVALKYGGCWLALPASLEKIDVEP